MIEILETALASAFRGTNVWGVSEQIKQRYSCLVFGFMGAEYSVQKRDGSL